MLETNTSAGTDADPDPAIRFALQECVVVPAVGGLPGRSPDPKVRLPGGNRALV